MSKCAIELSFRAVGVKKKKHNDRHLKNLKIKDDCQSICLFQMTVISRKLGCITNFDMFLLMMGFISLVDEIYAN